MRRIGVAERRARLGVRHRLATTARADAVVEVAESLVALHATDPATVHLAVLARMRGADVAVVERALYDDKTLIRLLGMRRTMFVVTRDVAPVVQAACTRSIAAAQRRRLLKLLADAGVAADGPGWLAEVEESTVAALQARGEATANELASDEPRLRTSLVLSEGKPYEAKQNITSRVLFQLAAEARIVRGKPCGSWTSSQYHWAPMQAWLPGGMADLATDLAQVELLRRWLAAFGPATLADLRWWTGLTVGEAKKALVKVQPVEVELAEGTGLVLADDLEPVAAAEPWAALLPGLDPTPMGWQQRDWYLGDHARALFDRTGNIGPTVWWDGRVVGGWAQRKDGEIVYRLLEDIGSDGEAAVAAAVPVLTAKIGSVRVSPRFPTPLERELTG